jgi:hypothetical protein
MLILCLFVFLLVVVQNDELRAKLNSLWEELDEQGRAPYIQKAMEDKERYQRALAALEQGSLGDDFQDASVPNSPDNDFQIPKRKK